MLGSVDGLEHTGFVQLADGGDLCEGDRHGGDWWRGQTGLARGYLATVDARIGRFPDREQGTAPAPSSDGRLRRSAPSESIWSVLYFDDKSTGSSSSCPLLLHIPLMGNCCSDPVNFDGDVDLYHFALHRAVGKGAFGKVCLLRPPHGSSPSSPVFFSARRSESWSTRSLRSSTRSSTSTRPSASSRRPSRI